MIQNPDGDSQLANLVKNDLPSNVAGAGNPDGFTQTAETDYFADNGMQILKPKSDREASLAPEGETVDPLWVKEEDDHFVSSPVEKPTNENFLRTDTENSAYEDSDSFGEPAEEADYDSLLSRWKQAGLPEKDFPADAVDFNGPQASIIADTIMEQLYMVEIFGKYDQEIDLVTPEKGKEIDVAIRVDRIGNKRVNKALTELSIENKNYVESVWEKTMNIDILINPENDQTMIVMRAKKDQEKGERFIGMSFDDFSNMLSVPSVRDGNSRINLPPVHLDNQKELIDFITAIYGIKVNGKLVGGDGVPHFNVKKWSPKYTGK